MRRLNKHRGCQRNGLKRSVCWLVELTAILWITTVAFSQEYDRFNPPYPRVALYSAAQDNAGWPFWSIGNRLHHWAQYDMVYIYGSDDENGPVITAALREMNPNQVIIGMGNNGLSLYDPPEFFAYRSYLGHTVGTLDPGATSITVDNASGVNSGGGPKYVVINNDVIAFTGISGNTLTGVPASGFEAIEQTHPENSVVRSPLRLYGPGVIPNFSEYCPVVDGVQAWDYLATKNLTSKMDWSERIYDGFFHDFFAYNLYLENHTLDFDLTGKNDYTEHSFYWVNTSQWQPGVRKWIEKEKQLMETLAPDMPNLFGVNGGWILPDYYNILNGHVFEGFQRWGGPWEHLKDDCLQWAQNGQKPSMMFIEDYIPEKWTYNGKDRFEKMRHGLATAMLFDCYYGMTYGDWYFIMFWYDEFETDMGYPTGPAQQLGNGLWVRYFDNGCVVDNPTGAYQTLNASSLTGGPYYRLRGGQDPDFNNGELFTGSVQLYGEWYGTNPRDKRGDGILLFNEPTTAISDIVVDNFYCNDSSPAQDTVEVVGNWLRKVAHGNLDFDLENPYYSQFGNRWKNPPNYEFDDAWGYQAVAPGAGEATAIWRPNIGVAGYYEISEWHGWHGDSPSTSVEADNVPFEIFVDGVSRLRGVYTQRANYGQWNRLGIFYLPAGSASYVKINNNANGIVIADAMRFKWLGDDVVPDETPPNAPTGVRIIQ
ncbi:hypothetical protein A2V82_05230 [candidate division KSB1 bacterium RBG_16_48_16]|nr:MAG: hypothetical protein A2V82_05230 [candidate division KSB1 bacterium RBG_16_48_16]